MTALDPVNGQLVKRGRLPNGGKFFASPVAADGKVFFVNASGRVTVVEATADWTVLASNDLGEACYATPAIAENGIYFRTESNIYCFALSDE